MLFYGIASGCEAIGGAYGWNEALYRTWYLTGAVWTAGWLGLGTAFLLGRTRFGYSFALASSSRALHVPDPATGPSTRAPAPLPAALLHRRGRSWLSRSRSRPTSRTSAGRARCSRPSSVRPILSLVLMAATTLPAPGYALDPGDRASRSRRSSRRTLRLLTPFMNITGGLALILGALLLGLRVHAEAARPAPTRWTRTSRATSSCSTC